MDMDMDNAAAFLAGTILYALGIVIIVIGTVVVNNIVHKYWKSWGWKFYPHWMNEHHARFMTPEEEAKIAPILKDENDAGRSNQSQGKS